MEIVIALIISALTAVFIALPFFLNRGRNNSDFEDEVAKDPVLERLRLLEGRKESLYSAIRDIDLDFGLGKLTKEDYDELRRKYRAEAAVVLRQIDGITEGSGAQELDAEIEAEIKKSRGAPTTSPQEDDIEKEILAARKSAPSEFSPPSSPGCPGCGSEIKHEDLFCSKCGAKLAGAEQS